MESEYQKQYCPYSNPDESSTRSPVLLKIHFNIIFPSTPSLSDALFPSDFLHQNFTHISMLQI
jgi:hypothetical protein